ncbi:hypothetical protein JTE90_013534 [Oedothorax gibbosus]|uniref:Uncharacterized protein n=1 Tax=Oedothorax gibbosus TaxID=931172 RepID=A0AAV6U9E7_9ARAC|nr:hypothetical protein JTE90_013534 [Oedothorax gibbosus]
MHSFIFLFVSAFLVPCLVSGVNDTYGCGKHSAPVEKFVASIYTALIVSNDPDFIDNFSIGGGEAGMHVYNVVLKLLEEARQCNAEEVAFIGGRAVAKAGRLTLPHFFRNVAYAVANTLSKASLLDCDSAIPLALEYFGYIQKETEGLDRRQFETYAQDVTFGWRDLLVAHHLDLGALTANAAEVFYQFFSDDGGQQKCKFDDDQDESPEPK